MSQKRLRLQTRQLMKKRTRRRWTNRREHRRKNSSGNPGDASEGVTQPQTWGRGELRSCRTVAATERPTHPVMTTQQQVNTRTAQVTSQLILRLLRSAAAPAWLLNHDEFTVWAAEWSDPPPGPTRPHSPRVRTPPRPPSRPQRRSRWFQRNLTPRLLRRLTRGVQRPERGGTDVPAVVKSSSRSDT